MSKPQFVYVIYIKAAPEKVWNGLLDPAMTRLYWMHENVSDWKPGSRWEHKRTDPQARWTSSAKWSSSIRRSGWCSRGCLRGNRDSPRRRRA